MQGESLFEIKCLFVDIIENERGVKKFDLKDKYCLFWL